MNRKDLIRRASEILRANGSRKYVSSQKQIFHVSDDSGNHKDFAVKLADREVIYTMDDVSIILDALLAATKDAIKVGEEVTIHGFGTLGLKYRKERQTKEIGTDNQLTISARFVPKFAYGSDLRTCAMIYGESFSDRMNLPDPIYEEDFGGQELEEGYQFCIQEVLDEGDD